MLFRQLFHKDSSTYTYLIADIQRKEAILIDPVLDETEGYIQLLTELDLSLNIAIDTHTHADHITALGKLREKTGCTTYMSKQADSSCANASFQHGSLIQVGKLTLKALYTPGHTDDSYCFTLEHKDQKYVFTGDTLLIRGTGRTDFQNGSAIDQYYSLFETLLTLPEETWVYPAHDYKGWMVSTIGEERQHNPRLQVKDLAAYQKIMNNLNLPDPKMMDEAVPANQACGNTLS